MARHFRGAARSRSRIQMLRQATADIACRCEKLERRCLLAAEYGTLQGIAFADENGNGLHEPAELLLPAVQIYADQNNNGLREFDEPTAETNQDGQYAMQLSGATVVIREYRSPDALGEPPLHELASQQVVIEAGAVTTLDLAFKRRLDWGDAPDPTYPTLAASNGARHLATKGYSLGNRIDWEPNGQPNANANGDDVANIGDEDGVTFLTPLVSGSAATVQVDFTSVMGLTGVLDAWIDFNANGSWADAGERIATTLALAPGANLLSFTVPAGAVAGTTYARFRLSPNGVSTFSGTGIAGQTSPLRGEVEDYLVRVEPGQQLDWGDAPDLTASGAALYPTRAVDDGARHQLSQNFTLGPSVDAENDGQPNSNATGDDLGGIDDENGVTFITPLVAGNAAQVEVVLNGAGGFLSAWFDFQADGSWAQAGDQIFSGVPLAPGANVLNFSIPATANTTAQTFARFRLAQTPSAITSFKGFGGVGEVEDYAIRVSPAQQHGELDWGDAPVIAGTTLQYPTLASQNGARHEIITGFRLGTRIDAEANGQPTILSDGDDTSTSDDEEGVFFLDPLIPGATARIRVDMLSPTGAGRLDAWIDWSADGNWSPPSDRIANSLPLVNGANIFVVNVPASAATGRTYSRFRLSFNGGLSFDGFGFEGEVEDHIGEIKNPTNRKLDWGDAPQLDAAGAPTAYPTTASVNGARHTLRPGFFLGFRADAELDGQPTFNADGDDLNALPDEDGVAFLTPLIPGGMAQVQVISSAGGVLDAWIDFTGNANWSDVGDRIATTYPLLPGANIINVSVPAGSHLGDTYARFRLSPNGVPSYDGYGYDGEVEDYRVTIRPRGDFDWGDAPKQYPTLAVDNGASHTLRPGFTLGNLIDAEPDGQPVLDANRDDGVGVDDEDGVSIVGGHITTGVNNSFAVSAPGGGVLDAWMDLNFDGDWNDAGEKILSGIALAAGANSLNWLAPAAMPTGNTYARFRLSPNGVASPGGFGFDGEVEDYIVAVRRPQTGGGPYDWGDAPAVIAYPTTAANNGAFHEYRSGFTLGHRWDSELDGQPSFDALRDDSVGIDDEDGVFFLDPLTSATVARIKVIAPSGGVLDAWIDWAGNGNWSDANDRIATTFPLVAGTNVLNVPVPAGLPATSYRSFSRFRLSPNGVASFGGFGFEGEVEDYRVIINGPTVVHDPTTGVVHVVGTKGNDSVRVRQDSNGAIIGIAIGGATLSSGDPTPIEEFSFNFSEVSGLSLELMDGDDHVTSDESTVDGSDFLVWQRHLSYDGGDGFDSLVVDYSSMRTGPIYVLEPKSSIAMLDGSTSQWGYIGLEASEFFGSMGDDRFLLSRGAGGDRGNSITIRGGLGDDEFHVDSFFDVWPEISIDGGSQNPGSAGDALTVMGANGRDAEYMPAPRVHGAGSLVGFNPQPDPPATLNFTGLEPVNFAFGNITLTLPGGGSGNDVIAIDPLSLGFGDSTKVSGTNDGVAFEHLIVTDGGTLTLNVATNDTGGVGGSSDVVDINGSIIGANVFTMLAGLADLTLNINDGSIPIDWNPGALGAAASVNIAGGATVEFGVTQQLSLLSMESGAIASLADGGGKVLSLGNLAMAGGAILDLSDNNMLVRNGVLGTTNGSVYNGITGLMQSGRNGGAWNGSGIVTSTPEALTKLTTLGIDTAAKALNLSAGQTTTWYGNTVDSTTVLVKYTYGGDANLDGFVSGDDYTRIDFAIAVPGAAGFANGDFNYDGFISADDYTIIDFNIAAQGPPFPSTAAMSQSSSSSPPTATAVARPEGAISLLRAQKADRDRLFADDADSLLAMAGLK